MDLGNAPTEPAGETSNPSEHGCAPKKRKNRINDTILSFSESARRDSNPRPSPWQGDTPPLSHLRISYGVPSVLRSVLSYYTPFSWICQQKIKSLNISNNSRFVHTFSKVSMNQPTDPFRNNHHQWNARDTSDGGYRKYIGGRLCVSAEPVGK